MSMLPLILTDVSLWRDGNTLIEGVSVTFSPGTKTIVLGHNGAGKSLLLRICHGLMGPDSGSVAWAEKSPEGHRRQAMVFQKPIMLRRSVRSNVTYGLKVNGVPKLRRQEIADMNLKRVGLADIAVDDPPLSYLEENNSGSPWRGRGLWHQMFCFWMSQRQTLIQPRPSPWRKLWKKYTVAVLKSS